MNHINELLATNMKAARKRLGISQTDLAEDCGVSISFIGEIEIGRKFPSSSTLMKIGNALQLEPYQLFYEPEQNIPERHQLYSDLQEALRRRIDDVIREVLKEHLS